MNLILNKRQRRLRSSDSIRTLVRETSLKANDLIQPIFVIEGIDVCEPIVSMPGINRMSIDRIITYVKYLHDTGIIAVAIFPNIDHSLKDESAEYALNKDNLVYRCIKKIKNCLPEMIVIADVALDPFLIHGHDGLVSKDGSEVLNDATVHALVKQSLLLAEAGADVLAPSDMMDGRVAEIRKNLEQEGFHDCIIASYAAKFASNFYGPFRDAIDSKFHINKTKLKDKKTYQIDYANKKESILACKMSVSEGADVLIIKPAITSLDIISEVSKNVLNPIWAYQVSGEYSMIKISSLNGVCDFYSTMYESLFCIKRSGANSIITYSAGEMAKYINNL